MASATVNGASLVANYNNTVTDEGEMGSSPTPGGEQGGDEQLSNNVYSMVTSNNNRVEDDNLQQWTCDSNDNSRKRASPSYTEDDENNPSSSTPLSTNNSTARSSKKRRKQSNPVRLATPVSRNVDKMAMEDYIKCSGDDLLSNKTNTRVSSSGANNEDFDTPTEEDEEVTGAPEEEPEDALAATSAPSSSQQLRAIVNVIEEDENEALDDDDDYDDGRVHRCPHCNVLFDVEDHLRRHIEEEHVQKILERQLQQQNQKNLIGGTTVDCKRNANSPFDLSTASSSSVSATFQRYDGRHSNSSSSDASVQEENKLFHQHQIGGHHSHHHHHHQQQQPQSSSAATLHSPKELPTASLMALSAFGAAPFLIPVLPTSSGTLLTRGSAIPTSGSITSVSSSGSGMGGVGSGSCSTLTRIFNPEAFCELCNKEFCNKYFLKTHKANKHGVYSLETLTSASPTMPTSTTTLSSSHPANSGLNFSPNNSNSNNGNRHHRRSGGGLGPSPPLALDALQTSPTTVREVRESQQLPIPSMIGPSSVSLGMLSNKVLPVMNPEAFCDICQKEFCNKYFLKKHRQKIHGIQDPPTLSSSPAGGGTVNPVTAASLVSAAAVASSISALVDSIAAAAATNTDMVNLHSGSTFGTSSQHHHHPHHHPVPPADLFYEYSARDLSAKIAAATQSSSKHSIQNLMGAGMKPSTTNQTNPSSSQNGSNAASNSGSISTVNNVATNDGGIPIFIPGNGGGSPSGEINRWVPGSITVAGHVFTPERLREMGVINVDAFCEICCKEFCNKYFLRTHKMNKHGVGVATNEFPVPPTTSGSILIKSPSSSHSHSGHHHNQQQSSQQQQPLSLVMDKDGCQQLQEQEGGRKSINSPGSNHSGSSFGRSTMISGIAPNPLEQPPSISSPSQLDSTQESGTITQDLICEVCSRPFSSTYLLKMHKFYFHNPSTLAAAALGAPDAPTSLIEDHIAAAEAMRRRCASGGGSSSCKSGDEAPTSGNDGGGNGNAAGPINDELQKLQTMIRELNTSPNAAAAAKDCSEVRCSVCLKEMKNKYYLRAHMMNEHGELHNEEADTSPDCFNIPVKNEPEDYSDSGAATPSKSISDPATSTPTTETTFCDLCGKDFCSKYFLRAHQLTAHSHEVQIKQEINPLNLNHILMPVPPDRIKVEATTNVTPSSGGSLNLAAINHHHQLSSMMAAAAAAVSPMTSSQERSNVTGRNFCEICNKELCNKYFMKTHMLKMHGINVDDKIHSGGVNGATIGGVMCDICQKELCSKYFLKVHKQNTHGCYEETPPITKENYVAAAAAAAAAAVAAAAINNNSQQQQMDAMQNQLSNDGYASDGVTTTTSSNGNRYFSHYTEVCPLCDRRFKSIKWLKTHVINDHADLAKDSGLAELLATESYLASTGEFSPPQMNNNNVRIPSLQQQRHSHHILSPRDYLNEANISPNKGSSKSPNSFQPHSHHTQHHHHHQSASRSSSTIAAAADDCCDASSAAAATTTTASTTSAATTAIFQADELGSTGAAIATATAGTSGGGGNGGCGVTSGGGGDIRSKGPMLPIFSHQLLHHRPRGNAGVIRKPITTITTTGSGGATTRIYHCSYCTYSTRWLSNLYAHEKRHTGLSSEGEKRFSCRVCHRAYRYNHSLQRHLISHKTTGILFKHVMNAAATNSNNMANVFQCSSTMPVEVNSQQQQSIAVHQHQHKPESDIKPKQSLICDDNEQPPASQVQQPGLGVTKATNLTPGSKGSKPPVRVKKYRCSKCGAKYRSREQCLEHIHQHHSSNARSHWRRNNLVSGNKVTLHCPGCDFSCVNGDVMANHLNRHHNSQQQPNEQDNDREAECNEYSVRKQVQKKQYSGTDETEEQVDENQLKQLHQQQMSFGQQQQPQLPMTYAVPQAPPTAGSFIMQPFLITQQQQAVAAETASSTEDPSSPTSVTTTATSTATTTTVTAAGSGAGTGSGRELKSPGSSSVTTFVPSLVYLPVSRKVNDTVTVTFNLIPA